MRQSDKPAVLRLQQHSFCKGFAHHLACRGDQLANMKVGPAHKDSWSFAPVYAAFVAQKTEVFKIDYFKCPSTEGVAACPTSQSTRPS